MAGEFAYTYAVPGAECMPRRHQGDERLTPTARLHELRFGLWIQGDRHVSATVTYKACGFGVRQFADLKINFWLVVLKFEQKPCEGFAR